MPVDTDAISLPLYLKATEKEVEEMLKKGRRMLFKITVKLVSPSPTGLMVKVPPVFPQVPEVAAQEVDPPTLNSAGIVTTNCVLLRAKVLWMVKGDEICSVKLEF